MQGTLRDKAAAPLTSNVLRSPLNSPWDRHDTPHHDISSPCSTTTTTAGAQNRCDAQAEAEQNRVIREFFSQPPLKT